MEKVSRLDRILNRIYYNLFFESCKKKIKFEFPSDIKRWDLIQEIIKKKNFSYYLEIGCDDDELFSKIKINNKIGVDPVSGGNIRSTSDEFFKNNKLKFDIIFIDGLHIYEQVKKDILNSIKVLNPNGIILLHDCLPREMSHQAVPRYRHYWNGDVWKAIVEFRQNPKLEIYTCKIDTGISMIQKKENTKILSDKILSYKKLKFIDFVKNYKNYMRILDCNEFLKKI